MGLWAILQKAEQSLRRRLETAVGKEAAVAQQLEVRRGILEKIEAAILEDTSGKVFPYSKVSVTFAPDSAEQNKECAAAFPERDAVRAEIRQLLQDASVRYPENLEIEVAVEPQPEGGPLDAGSREPWTVNFHAPVLSMVTRIPEVRLEVLRGVAEQPHYCLRKDRILIGRAAEVLDREGRVVRKNDIVFLDNGEDVNGTVGYAHARIWWDAAQEAFFLLDESSRYGTCILREGRSLEMPELDGAGVMLQSGDEVFCGRACLRCAWDSED